MADHDYDTSIATAEITLRPIDIDDWAAVHEWASTIEACRYQAWGPNTVAETKAFVAQAASQWGHEPQDRYVWIAENGRAVLGLGELKIQSRRWRQGELGYAVHVKHWGRGLGTAIARSLLSIVFDSMDLHRVMATCDPAKPGLNRGADQGRHDIRGTAATHHQDPRRLGDSSIFGILADEWREGRHQLS